MNTTLALLVIVAVTAAVLGVALYVCRQKTSRSQKNALIMRRFGQRLWNEGDLTVIEKVIAPGAVIHFPIGDLIGPEGFKAMHVDAVSGGFSDTRFTLHDMLAQGDLVAARWETRQRHTGPFQGFPPTGKEVHMTGLTMARLQNGQIVEAWDEWDLAGLMRQLGAFGAMEEDT